MRGYLLFAIFIFFVSSAFSQKNDSVFAELNFVIKNKQQYVVQKEDRISEYKNMRINGLPLINEYGINKRLYTEYKKFRVDSAIYYAKRNLEITSILDNKELTNEALLQLAVLYSSSGSYRECENILESINQNSLSKEQLADYYESYYQFFSHYGAGGDLYIRQMEKYRDSLLMVLEPTSSRYKINLAEQNVNLGKIEDAEKSLLELLNNEKKDTPTFAMVAYLLGRVYQEKGNKELEKRYFAISAIADIKNAIKDNASIQMLALIFYGEEDIDKASRFTQLAIEDAVFCNVQFRTVLITEYYSIINTSYLEKEAARKSELKLLLIGISILSAILAVAIIFVYRQMKKVSRIRKELSEANTKLNDSNNKISKTNDKLNEKNILLLESNRIKEEYIAHFFDLCSAYISKLENYRKSLNKKVINKQLDELFKMLKSTTVVDDELEELYSNFDNIFLNLYPTFVKDFNTLLIPEEQVILKPGELLNTELRIFALIRLGITDSVKIAAFLRYSISTIYNYRTKTRNKAAVSRDEFEKMVMKIGTIPYKNE